MTAAFLHTSAAFQRIRLEPGLNLVPHPAKHLHLFLIRTWGVGGIVEGPVKTLDGPGKDRAGVVGFAADGDHGVDRMREELLQALGHVPPDVDSDFRHGPDGQRMNEASGLGTGAVRLEDVARRRPEDPFGHLAAAGIAGAKDKHLRFHAQKKTGASSQGMTVRTRGIFRISTTVGLRGFSSSSLYQTGTEIRWAVKEHRNNHFATSATFARNLLRNPRATNHYPKLLSSKGARF